MCTTYEKNETLMNIDKFIFNRFNLHNGSYTFKHLRKINNLFLNRVLGCKGVRLDMVRFTYEDQFIVLSVPD